MTQSRDMAVVRPLTGEGDPRLVVAQWMSKTVLVEPRLRQSLNALLAIANRDAPGSGSSAKADPQPGSADSSSQWRPTDAELANCRSGIAEVRAGLKRSFGDNPSLIAGMGEIGVDIDWLEHVCDHFSLPAIDTTAGEAGS